MDWYPPQKRLLVPRMKGTKIKLINRKEGNKIAKKIKTSHGAATRPKVEEKGEKKKGDEDRQRDDAAMRLQRERHGPIRRTRIGMK